MPSLSLWRFAFLAALLAVTQAQQLVASNSKGVRVLFQTDAWLAPNVHFKADDKDWTDKPGVAMKPSSFTFNNGLGDWDNNHDNNYKVDSKGMYSVVSYVLGPNSQSLLSKNTGKKAITILFRVPTWTHPRIHFNAGRGWTELPGVVMQPSNHTGRFSAKHGWFQYTIPSATWADLDFSDGFGHWDSNSDKNYHVEGAGTYAFLCSSGERNEPSDSYVRSPGYHVASVKEAGDDVTIHLAVNDNGSPYNGDDIAELVVNVHQVSASIVRVHITDANVARWQVPEELYTQGAIGGRAKAADVGDKYEFSYTRNPFTFKVTRKSDKYVLFDSSALGLVFKDQYLQIATAIEGDLSVYGLGESTRETMRLRTGEKHTLWTRDQAAFIRGVNLYGSHPFFMGVNSQGKAHGVFLFNSNGMDVTREDKMVVYQAIGGVLDFFVMTGPAPANVLAQYTSLIGRPKLQPFWAYGFHQCRWRYTSVSHFHYVVEQYEKAKIPLDVMWADIDYMDRFYDFTLDPNNFAQSSMQQFMNDLHDKHQRFVPIIDPGIRSDPQDKAYARGMELDIYIKDTHGKPYLGQVWPGPTVFPDFLHPNTSGYWQEQLQRMYKQFEYDGLWIDMNEPANFCPGLTCVQNPSKTCPLSGGISEITTCCLDCMNDGNKHDNPPFRINNIGNKDALFSKTISTNSRQHGDIAVYNTHNMFGFTEAIATNKAQEQITGKRSFVLSRSTFPGSGVHTAHWTGDNMASWNDLEWSIPQILSFGLYGIPMIGADICGFLQTTTVELCARWMAVGSFYPFSRNHNEFYAEPQEAYVWPEVADVSRKFLGMRYRLLAYIYSLGFEAHATGAPLARALFMEFPEDGNTHGVDRQFMLGDALLVTPVLYQGASSITGYVPAGTWYNLFDSKRITSKGKKFTWNVKLDDMPVHVRGGSIIPMYQASLTTTAARATAMDLLVALPEKSNAVATGTLIIDDGESIADDQFTHIELSASGSGSTGKLSTEVTQHKYSGADDTKVAKIIVLGVEKKPTSVSSGTFEYDAELLRLEIDLTGKKQSISDAFSVSWN
ncbi:TPA: hypothetical protein N0F65_010515 [Lagenidium giganteum]|uniref:alpha-glucosidase n=1 Tax=Lagenidium giganteum TaxID=4803 RepID=A0AAV2ZDL0_9STRA|nr:TPA: hypothetical protein N0F65_010515 [Lagenidium giganteum]